MAVQAVAHVGTRRLALRETMRSRIVTAPVYRLRRLLRVEVEVVVSAAAEDLLVVEVKPHR